MKLSVDTAETEAMDTATVSAPESGPKPAIPPPSFGFRALQRLGWGLVWLGALTLGFVAHQLWITTWFATANQSALTAELEDHFAAAEITEVPFEPVVAPGEPPPDPSTISGGAAGDIGTLLAESIPDEGAAFAEIRIPALDSLADGWAVVEGVSVADLKNGAGHMPWTPMPGQPGNSVISGHRTTYGAPFSQLDELVAGDTIEVETALGTHVYAVRNVNVVKPTDVWVTHPRSGAWLTLTTCNPEFSARERLVVFAELVEGPNADVILGRT